jgi:NAD(P)-dependent dehydrogenase (short-subunit alcohol dehydrogenase family)
MAKPGIVATDIVAELLAVPSTADAYRAQMPIGREGQPDEAAAMVLSLLGDRAAWVTGQCIGIDGGNALRAARRAFVDQALVRAESGPEMAGSRASASNIAPSN